MAYPANDITAALLRAGLDGTTVDLPPGVSVYHQAVAIRAAGFEIVGVGSLDFPSASGEYSVLQMYGGPPGADPVEVYGQECTGPAAWFLDADGNPIGAPNSGPQHPAGVQFNPFQTVGSAEDGVFQDFTHDDNVTLALDPTTGQSTDAWCGAVLEASSSTGFTVENFGIVNAFGGLYWFPDPVHVDGASVTVSKYRMLHNAIAPNPSVNGGVPGGLIFGNPEGAPGCGVSNVDVIGFLEFDVSPMQGLSLDGAICTHILVGALKKHSSPSATDWGGAVWNGVRAKWPTAAGPVLNFSPGYGPYTDWTIENSVFDGRIANPDLFAGTWGPNNTPASL